MPYSPPSPGLTHEPGDATLAYPASVAPEQDQDPHPVRTCFGPFCFAKERSQQMRTFQSQVADTPVIVHYSAERVMLVETVEDRRPIHLERAEQEALFAKRPR